MQRRCQHDQSCAPSSVQPLSHPFVGRTCVLEGCQHTCKERKVVASRCQMIKCSICTNIAQIMVNCSNAQMLECSNAQMLKCPNAQLLKGSNAQMLKWPNAQMAKCSNAQLLQCSNAAMPSEMKCQRINLDACFLHDIQYLLQPPGLRLLLPLPLQLLLFSGVPRQPQFFRHSRPSHDALPDHVVAQLLKRQETPIPLASVRYIAIYMDGRVQ